MSSKEESNYKWWVPITWTSKTESNFIQTNPRNDIWLTEESPDTEIDVPQVPIDDWLIFNIQETAYCRVNYDMNNWKLIKEQLILDHNRIHQINRAQIIDDSLNLARAGN